jgi:hypothetical protein
MSAAYDYFDQISSNPFRKRGEPNGAGVMILDIPNEKDLESQPLKREPTVHNDYIIDEDGDKIFIGGHASVVQQATDADYGDQIGTKIPEVKATDPIKDSVPRIEFANSENSRKGTGSGNREHNYPPDPEPGYDEALDALGHTIIESVTDFPESKTRLIKRSMTPDEQRTAAYFQKL